MEIIQMLPIHWEDVRTIYLQGIASKQATFQKEAPTWEEFDQAHLAELRYVAVTDGAVAGWAALSPVSPRRVYAGVAEVSIYIHAAYRGKGFGSVLLQRLVDESEAHNIWTLQSGIFPENLASIALHERQGFRKIGYREKIGKMDGIWRDTVLMERRSKVTGQD